MSNLSRIQGPVPIFGPCLRSPLPATASLATTWLLKAARLKVPPRLGCGGAAVGAGPAAAAALVGGAGAAGATGAGWAAGAQPAPQSAAVPASAAPERMPVRNAARREVRRPRLR